ncbi:MAG: MFS transporter [Limibacillus sp.]
MATATEGRKEDKDLVVSLYELAVGEEDARLCRDISDAHCNDQPRNFLLQSAALSLSKIGDGLADAKVVLPWLLAVLGAPGFFIGMLVPVRESLALLPQMLFGSAVRRYAVRKWFWVAGSLAQGGSVLLMALVAGLGMEGAAAGWTVLALLVVQSLARGVSSVASKDTLGKTVAKRKRGRVNGYASSISGVVTGLTGLYLIFTPEEGRSDLLLFGMIAAAGCSWLLGAATYAAIEEHPGATDGGRGLKEVLADQLRDLLREPDLQRFLLARSLLLCSAFSGPIYVALAQRNLGSDIATLGLLVVATGIAGAVSSSVWGALSDRSSRKTMMLGAALTGVLAAATLALAASGSGLVGSLWLYGVLLFVLGIAHAGVRIGRKTHLVDMAGEDKRSQYVALSNSAIGVILLVFGAVIGAVMSISLLWALAAIAVTALLALLATARLGEAQD